MLAQLPDSKRLLEGISTGETRLLEIVNNLLDISKIEGQVLNIAKVKLKLGDILHNVCCEFEAALAERKQTLALTGVDELPIISADPDLMFKLFDQLLSNAIKYTPDGGSITVTGQLRTASDFTQDKEVVEILVSDTGIGIDPAYHEMIFDKFFQAGPIKLHSTSRVNFMGGGPGLGLSIARGVVQAHGGGIWVESPGFDETTCPGSCFHVYLPIGDHTPEG
jgi:signal transduction histidine kinase